MMNNYSDNPWLDMNKGTRRRVDIETVYDYFWIRDHLGKHGFALVIPDQEYSGEKIFKLKGIIAETFFDANGTLGFYLTLEDQNDLEIFCHLCQDLIAFAEDRKARHQSEIYDGLLSRLKRWHDMLTDKRTRSLSMQKQMGIFSELTCLDRIIAPIVGYNNAVDCWVGPNQDKQDFVLYKSALEVKSHTTTKGAFAYISSLEQLWTEKENLFLVVYGLSIAPGGFTIRRLLDKIQKEIDYTHMLSLNQKLFDSGYYVFEKPIEEKRFVVDSELMYEVNEKFPRISICDVDSRINDIRYKINLNQCRECLCETEILYRGEKND